MLKFLRKFLILLVVFVLGVAGTAFLMNNETTDDRSDMNNPTLPEVMVDFGGNLSNRMYGYKQKMRADYVTLFCVYSLRIMGFFGPETYTFVPRARHPFKANYQSDR